MCLTLAVVLSLSYGMRFISKVLKDTLHEKFPDATEDELLKVQSIQFKLELNDPLIH